MSRPKLVLLVIAWVVLIGFGVKYLMIAAGERASQERLRSRATRQAEVATVELMKRMKTQLQSAMKDGGPAAAMEVCQAVAQSMTTEYSAEIGEGFSIYRTALKLRNPANKPNPDERAWMETTAQYSTGESPIAPYDKVITNDDYDRELLYWTPIYVAPVCLTCHGGTEQIPDDVEVLLGVRYPDDAAIDFVVGDFRGIVGVKVNLDHWTPPQD